MMRFLFIALFSLTSLAAFAGLDGFFDRYSFVRDDDGKLVAVRDRSLSTIFRIAPYLKHLQNALKEEQSMMMEKGDYEGAIADLFVEDQFAAIPRDGELPTEVRAIIASMKSLEKVDVDYIFEHSDFKDVIRYFEDSITKVLQTLDPMVLARLDDPKFFYKKAVTVGVVTTALNYAKKKLKNFPMLVVASYSIIKIDELIRERRLYHQNVLLHYLEAYSESDLKIDPDERKLILSSIYESRIHWMNFLESGKAKKTWKEYGVNSFYGSIRYANNEFRRTGSTLYSKVNERLNFAFLGVEIDGVPMIINLFHKDAQYSKKYSVAYYPNAPLKIYRKRLVLQLAEMGINFVPIGQWYKEKLVVYMRSMYDNQRLTEGALFAYFESKGEADKAKIIMMQNVNPYESFEIK